MASPDTPQPLTLLEAIIPVAGLVVLIAISFYLFGDAGASGPNQVALTVATMIAVFIGWRRGHTLEALREAAVASVGSGVGAIFILLAVGSLIGTWAMSGTLVAMVYYGLKLLSPNYFYMTAAIICGVVSVSIGSSWTVVGTIGIGLMGIAQNMGLSPAVTAGAVISGAYLGDTTSPLSDSANLAAAAAGVDLYEHIRETAADFGAVARDRPGRVLAARPTRRFRRQRQDAVHPGHLPPLPGDVPAADLRRRARGLQGSPVHHDLPRRPRRWRARRVRGTGPRDRVRRHR